MTSSTHELSIPVLYVYTSTGAHRSGALDPIAHDALTASWPNVAVIDHDGKDFGYYEFLKSCWQYYSLTGFIMVEHDIVVRPDTIARLQACKHDYCAWQYPIVGGRLVGGLGFGCMKFGPTLIQRVPGLFTEILEINWPGSGHNKSFPRLDGKFHSVLQQKHGNKCHLHMPPLWHRNPTNSGNYDDPPSGYLPK